MKNLTKEERYIVAEYVYSYQTDVLIKSDADRLIDLFIAHNVIKNEKQWKSNVAQNKFNVAMRLMDYLDESLSPKNGKMIMDEYYGRLDKNIEVEVNFRKTE